MNSKVKSWYSLPSWPTHVSLYLKTEDIEVASLELRNALTFKGVELMSESALEA